MRDQESIHYPKCSVVVIRNCVTPPTKLVLARMLQAEADAKNLLLGMDEDHMPDAQWMMRALATLNPNHAIFAKSYRPVVERPRHAERLERVNNEDCFYDDLPLLTDKERKGRAMPNLTREQRLELNMAKQKDKIDRAKA